MCNTLKQTGTLVPSNLSCNHFTVMGEGGGVIQHNADTNKCHISRPCTCPTKEFWEQTCQTFASHKSSMASHPECNPRHSTGSSLHRSCFSALTIPTAICIEYNRYRTHTILYTSGLRFQSPLLFKAMKTKQNC